jgi:hypothetical protein
VNPTVISVCLQPTDDYRPDPTEDELMFPRKTGVREATLLLLKEKCGRYMQLRVSADMTFRRVTCMIETLVIMRLVSVHPKYGGGLTAEVQVRSQVGSYVFLSEQVALCRVLSFYVIPSVIHI